MNSLIESLNGWGNRFLEFAWPMFWQSTLLIALVFAVEFALRRKIRPEVRYALWLAVLLKLLLPPSLALPTGLAWWLRPGTAAPARTPTSTFVVTANVSARTLPPLYYPAPPVRLKPAPARTAMSPAAWLLIGWSCISVGLLGWLAVRWRRVTGKVHRAARTPSPASGVALQELFDEAKRAAGVRRVVRLRLVEQPVSPAVYGLFHPVILLPQSLVERIAPEQLRAVLLHELIHFRRADVWINCAQSLLQIVYWWHPLVWLANARIRRVREEAVDDTVMLALRDDAEHYAPALLEVAKLALNRPLATLGLVGILESRSALQHRIERLMNFTTPGRAGLSIVSVLGIAAFSALALPMGEAPPKSATLAGALTSASAGQSSLAPAAIPSAARPSDSASQSSALDGSVIAAPSTNLIYTGTGWQKIMRKLEQIRISRFSCDNEPLADVIHRLTIETKELDPDRLGIVFTLRPGPNPPPAASTAIDPNTGLPVAARASSAVNDLESVAVRLKGPLTNVRLADVLDAIATSADKPIKYSIVDYGVVFSPKPNEPELHMRSFRVDPNAFFLRLEEAGAVSYSANDTPDQPGPVVVPKVHVGGTGFENWNGSNGDGLKFVTRTNAMDAAQTAIINYFLSLGVDLRPETGKDVIYSDRSGNLLFNATKQDLDIIEAALQSLNAPQPQINLKVTFVEVGSDDNRGIGSDSILGNVIFPALSTNSLSADTNAAFTLSGILTDPQYRTVLHALEQRAGSDVLGEAQVTTLSGRQAQIQVTDERFVALGGATMAGGSANGGGKTNTVIPATAPFPLGPTVDLIPILGADGYTIQLTVLPTLVDFTRYDDPVQVIIANQRANSNGVSVLLVTPLPLPHVRLRQVTVNAIVWDGQTLVLNGPALDDPRRLFRSDTNAPPKKNLLIFVTPTLIDPAGNRVHPDEK